MKTTAWLGLLLVIGLAACATESETTEVDHDRWTTLYDGETLDGWFVHHGDLPFEAREGEIVGATAVDIPTRYLTTVNQYGDFILELEMNNATGQNSGVQFRSVTDAPFYTGLTGYQLEVDPSERQWTGGIYFEGVGTWQHAPINNPECVAAWNTDDWNALRIEAKGEQMRTFVNGTPCAYLFDQYLHRGHIGLQIHSIGANPDAAGAETRWRNIRILETPEADDYSADALKADSNSHLIDRLSPVEEAQGWELARDRIEDASNWRLEYIQNPINAEVWTVNVMEVEAGDRPASAIILVPESHYDLIVDMQMQPGTSGEVLYPVTTKNAAGQLQTCVESYRIFDDRSLEERSAKDPKLMGSLTNKIAAENLSEVGRPKRVLYDDAWRRVGISVKDSGVEHWLNAVKVVEYNGCENAIGGEPVLPPVTVRVDTGSLLFRTIKIRAGHS